MVIRYFYMYTCIHVMRAEGLRFSGKESLHLVDNDPEDICPEELCCCVKELKLPGSDQSARRREEPSIAQYRTEPVARGSLA